MYTMCVPGSAGHAPGRKFWKQDMTIGDQWPIGKLLRCRSNEVQWSCEVHQRVSFGDCTATAQRFTCNIATKGMYIERNVKTSIWRLLSAGVGIHGAKLRLKELWQRKVETSIWRLLSAGVEIHVRNSYWRNFDKGKWKLPYVDCSVPA